MGVRTVHDGADPSRSGPDAGVLLAAGGLRPQRRDAPAVQRRPAEPGQVVHRQPGRHRRGAAGRHGPRRRDRPDGRGVVAAVAPDRPVRAVDPRPGPAATPHHLRRRRGRAVRERVELLHGGRQGDVRARQDQSGGAVLAGLRRPLPEALRPPPLPPGSLPPAGSSRADGSSRPGRSATWPASATSTRRVSPTTVERFNEHAAAGRRPRLRTGRVGVQPGAG